MLNQIVTSYGLGGLHLGNDGDPNGSESRRRHDVDIGTDAAGEFDASIVPS